MIVFRLFVSLVLILLALAVALLRRELARVRRTNRLALRHLVRLSHHVVSVQKKLGACLEAIEQ